MESLQIIEPQTEEQLKEVVTKLNRDQIIWLGGYLAATLKYAKIEDSLATLPTINTISEQKTLTILYGSQTGNSLKVAELAHNEAKNNGLKSKVISMDDYKPRAIQDETQLLIVVSTHGEGEPPTTALTLHEALQGKRVSDLPHLSYAVIALGDSSYLNFCQTGTDFHQFLKQKQANPIQDVVLLDTDFENHLPALITKTVSLFTSSSGNNAPQPTAQNGAPVSAAAKTEGEVEIIEKIQLNGQGSNKETWHIELDAPNIEYQPGDSLEVFASNPPKLVEAVIETLNLNPAEKVNVLDNETTLENALLHHYEITLVTPKVLKSYATFLSNTDLDHLLDDAVKLESFLYGTDFLDLITNYKTQLTSAQLFEILRPLPPRAYSIASSPQESEGEIHLTVGTVRYKKDERQREGVCSTFLADRVDTGSTLKVRIKPNLQFRLPEDGAKDIIMIGAGTGIAPFRAFLQHRDVTNATGKNWIFFGDQHFSTDFLYQSELLKYRKEGVLTKIDVAFSRDQEEKIYVQNKLTKSGAEVWEWLQNGAYIYICGDRKKMAKDVKSALLAIFVQHGKLTEEESEALLLNMKKEKRFQEDVY